MKFKENLLAGLKAAFEDKRKASTTLLTSTLFFILLALSTSINYTIQMFSAGTQYWITAIQYTITGLYLNGGWTEIILNLLYAILVGIITINTYTEFITSGLNLKNFSGAAPGILVAGCAGCGVGILSIIGLTGIITTLPLQGLTLKIGGLVLIIYFIARIGNPAICRI